LRKTRPAPSLARRIERLLDGLGLKHAELSVLFVGDTAMRTLNRTYRNKDQTTDVLSFSMREGRFPDIQPDLLGDVVICLPQAARQARVSGMTAASEIDRLMVHGLVHLLGYDHEQGPKEAARMAAKERQLLLRLSA